VDRQSLGKAIENADRRVFQPALDPTNIGAVHVRLEGKAILREIALHSNPS
jgi:hypothetical protein